MLQYHSAPALQHDAHVTGASRTTLEVAEAYCQYFNPWTLKFTSWKQQFPGVEHLAHFPMSPLTLCPLHGGQTSQGKCAWVAPAFDPVNDINESRGMVHQKWRCAQPS